MTKTPLLARHEPHAAPVKPVHVAEVRVGPVYCLRCFRVGCFHTRVGYTVTARKATLNRIPSVTNGMLVSRFQHRLRIVFTDGHPRDAYIIAKLPPFRGGSFWVDNFSMSNAEDQIQRVARRFCRATRCLFCMRCQRMMSIRPDWMTR